MNARLMLTATALLAAACGASSDLDSGVDAGPASTPPASTAMVTQALNFTASDRTRLRAYLSGAGDYRARPLIVEFSPYAPTAFAQQFSAPPAFGRDFGPAYNYLEVNARGTGQSGGVWGAVGPRDQQDVSEVLAWACRQPWSNGHIGLYGFSASAIAVYNALHLPLDCVDAASLMAGSEDLYRDLLYPGGIFNFLPATVVAFGVGGPLLASVPADLGQGEPLGGALQSMIGLLGLDADILAHTTDDSYWAVRSERRNPAGPNRFPVLADTSFYDPEPRGPFESFKLLRSLGVTVHLMTYGAHDGFPAGTQGPFPEFQLWFDHYLLGRGNGVETHPAVQLLLGNGSDQALMSGDYSRVDAADWPVPGTRWQALYFDATRSGSAHSLNDGSLRAAPAPVAARQGYPDLPSLGTASDPASTGAVSAVLGTTPLQLFDILPLLRRMNTVEPLSLSYTTPPLSAPLRVAGQGSLDLFVATATPSDDLYAVIADVAPDGTANPIAAGRLRTSFPAVVAAQSVIDADGQMVQPYGDYSVRQPATPGQVREYHVEFWPIGNVFPAGHRLRLYLLGTSDFMLPLPGLNLVSIGGSTPSRLLLPVLPGSDSLAAIGAAP